MDEFHIFVKRDEGYTSKRLQLNDKNEQKQSRRQHTVFNKRELYTHYVTM